MVKLLRLKSNEKLLYFDSSIQDSLILKPGSKIALQSIAWDKAGIEYVVDNSNDEFLFIYDGHHVSEVIIPSGTFDITNHDELIKNITNSVNNAMSIDTPMNVGLNFSIDLKLNKLRFNFFQNSLIDFFKPIGSIADDYRNVGVTSSAAGQYSKAKADAPDNAIYNSALFGILDTYFFQTNSGCGILRCKLVALSNNAAHTGFYIGLSNTEGDNMGGNFDFSTDKLNFAIECRNTVLPYRFLSTAAGTDNKTIADATIIPGIEGGDDNDVIEISCNKGKIEGRVYSDAVPAGTLLFSEAYTQNNLLYPIIAFKDGPLDDPNALPHTAIKSIRYTQEKPVKVENINNVELVTEAVGTPAPPPQDRVSADIEIHFPSDSFAQYLGFSQTIDFINARGDDFHLLATKAIEHYDASESYIVELQSLGLQSYDFANDKQSRRNILSVIQNKRNKIEEDVSYVSENPLFIDLNNAENMIIKNIRARVLNTNEQNVDISGISNMVLLID